MPVPFNPASFLYMIALSMPLFVAFGPVIAVFFYRVITEDVWHHVGIAIGMAAPVFMTTVYMLSMNLSQGHISAYKAPVTFFLPLAVIPVVCGLHCYSIREFDHREVGLTAFSYLVPVLLFPLFLISLGLVGI